MVEETEREEFDLSKEELQQLVSEIENKPFMSSRYHEIVEYRQGSIHNQQGVIIDEGEHLTTPERFEEYQEDITAYEEFNDNLKDGTDVDEDY